MCLAPFFLGQIKKGLWKKLAYLLNSQGNITFIEPLAQLISSNKRDDCIKFNELVNNLRAADNAIRRTSNTEDNVHSFFLKVLGKYVATLPSDPDTELPICPRNIMPLHIYQEELLGYADADYENLLNDIEQLEIYQNSFEKAYNALLQQ